ncbi:MAG: protein kinase [Chlamydiia bacterium]|nr:protein kinase [Chlamydiia bacterium]
MLNRSGIHPFIFTDQGPTFAIDEVGDFQVTTFSENYQKTTTIFSARTSTSNSRRNRYMIRILGGQEIAFIDQNSYIRAIAIKADSTCSLRVFAKVNQNSDNQVGLIYDEADDAIRYSFSDCLANPEIVKLHRSSSETKICDHYGGHFIRFVLNNALINGIWIPPAFVYQKIKQEYFEADMWYPAFNPTVSKMRAAIVKCKCYAGSGATVKDRYDHSNSRVSLENYLQESIFEVGLENTGTLRNVFSYDKDRQVMLTFRNKVIFWLGGNEYEEKPLPKPAYNAGVVLNGDVVIILTEEDIGECLLIDRRSWRIITTFSLNRPGARSSELCLSAFILDIHRNLPLVAFLVNLTSVRVFHLDFQQEQPTLSAASAATAAPLTPSISISNSIGWPRGDFEEIKELEKPPISQREYCKVYKVSRNSETVVFKGFPIHIDEKHRSAILQEKQVWRGLDHPNIVKFIGLAKTAKRVGLLFEYLPSTLVMLYQDHPLQNLERKTILNDICLGTHYLHSQTPPILHRDIRASNILLTSEGQAKLNDLGFSRQLREEFSEHYSSMTHSYNWSAPECWENVTSTKTDIYAIGMTLFEITAREIPFAKDSPQMIYNKVTHSQLPSLPAADDPFKAIFQRCCELNHDHRYNTADDIRKDIKEILLSP